MSRQLDSDSDDGYIRSHSTGKIFSKMQLEGKRRYDQNRGSGRRHRDDWWEEDVLPDTADTLSKEVDDRVDMYSRAYLNNIANEESARFAKKEGRPNMSLADLRKTSRLEQDDDLKTQAKTTVRGSSTEDNHGRQDLLRQLADDGKQKGHLARPMAAERHGDSHSHHATTTASANVQSIREISADKAGVRNPNPRTDAAEHTAQSTSKTSGSSDNEPAKPSTTSSFMASLYSAASTVDAIDFDPSSLGDDEISKLLEPPRQPQTLFSLKKSSATKKYLKEKEFKTPYDSSHKFTYSTVLPKSVVRKKAWWHDKSLSGKKKAEDVEVKGLDLGNIHRELVEYIQTIENSNRVLREKVSSDKESIDKLCLSKSRLETKVDLLTEDLDTEKREHTQLRKDYYSVKTRYERLVSSKYVLRRRVMDVVDTQDKNILLKCFQGWWRLAVNHVLTERRMDNFIGESAEDGSRDWAQDLHKTVFTFRSWNMTSRSNAFFLSRHFLAWRHLILKCKRQNVACVRAIMRDLRRRMHLAIKAWYDHVVAKHRIRQEGLLFISRLFKARNLHSWIITHVSQDELVPAPADSRSLALSKKKALDCKKERDRVEKEALSTDTVGMAPAVTVVSVEGDEVVGVPVETVTVVNRKEVDLPMKTQIYCRRVMNDIEDVDEDTNAVTEARILFCHARYSLHCWSRKIIAVRRKRVLYERAYNKYCRSLVRSIMTCWIDHLKKKHEEDLKIRRFQMQKAGRRPPGNVAVARTVFMAFKLVLQKGIANKNLLRRHRRNGRLNLLRRCFKGLRRLVFIEYKIKVRADIRAIKSRKNAFNTWCTNIKRQQIVSRLLRRHAARKAWQMLVSGIRNWEEFLCIQRRCRGISKLILNGTTATNKVTLASWTLSTRRWQHCLKLASHLHSRACTWAKVKAMNNWHSFFTKQRYIKRKLKDLILRRNRSLIGRVYFAWRLYFCSGGIHRDGATSSPTRAARSSMVGLSKGGDRTRSDSETTLAGLDSPTTFASSLDKKLSSHRRSTQAALNSGYSFNSQGSLVRPTSAHERYPRNSDDAPRRGEGLGSSKLDAALRWEDGFADGVSNSLENAEQNQQLFRRLLSESRRDALPTPFRPSASLGGSLMSSAVGMDDGWDGFHSRPPSATKSTRSPPKSGQRKKLGAAPRVFGEYPKDTRDCISNADRPVIPTVSINLSP